ncbi:MAG: hypothetical protein GQ545_06750 [Candidatus Aminicenantes bacterium]|jgi:hypothetical protein|nr:hypothetical protein [Candidatus Aminicenantes bacterium]
MTCQNIKELFPEFLTGELDRETQERVQSHLASCDSCREELENLSAIWTKLGVIPEEQPSDEVRTRFYTMLEAYKQGMTQERQPSRLKKMFNDVFEHVWPKRPAFQFSMAVVFLAVGVAAGIFLSSQGQNGTQLAKLQNEVQDMQQALAISLLDRPSASERLQGVSISSHMNNPNSKTLEALLYTLDNDKNVNVRLAAVDALYLFYDYPGVKEGLLGSLEKQPSPLVQVALIDLIVNMRERQAVDALRLLLEDEMLNPDVKKYAERGLQQLSF